jgi:hypothetical protein
VLDGAVHTYIVTKDAAGVILVYIDGVLVTPDSTNIVSTWLASGQTLTYAAPVAGQTSSIAAVWNRKFSPTEARDVGRNPWLAYASLRRPWDRPAPPASVTVYYPGSDISPGGWVSSTGGSLASCLDESVASDADYITSPDLTTSATLAWQSSIPAGTWDIAVRGEYLGTSGQIRVVLLDAGGSTVGTSSWQALTSSFATYTLTVTTSGTSTKFRYEVQP